MRLFTLKESFDVLSRRVDMQPTKKQFNEIINTFQQYTSIEELNRYQISLD